MDSEPHLSSPADRNIADVRMRGFAQRTTVVEALNWLDARLSALAAEKVELSQAAGRVLAADVVASRDIPCFDRSMMDGFALHAVETHGATSYNPLEFTIVGESLPGSPYEGDVAAGQAVRIMTGCRCRVTAIRCYRWRRRRSKGRGCRPSMKFRLRNMSAVAAKTFVSAMSS